MTNTAAAVIFVLLAVAAIADGLNGWQVSVFLGQKFLLLIDFIAIWR